MKPPVSLLDPAFRYVNAASTDLRKTFARIRREQADIAKAKAEQEQRERRIVTSIRRKA